VKNSANLIMPVFVFERRRDVELEAGYILAGDLVVNIPKPKPSDEIPAQAQRMTAAIIQKLIGMFESGRIPDDAILYGWPASGRPPNADQIISDDELIAAWASDRLIIGVRVAAQNDGYLRVDSDMLRQMGLSHEH
jgi:hypothetical protein